MCPLDRWAVERVKNVWSLRGSSLSAHPVPGTDQVRPETPILPTAGLEAQIGEQAQPGAAEPSVPRPALQPSWD